MKGCTECWEQATHSHHEYNVMIYSCDKHKCDECNLIKDDNMTERRPHWDDELIFAVMSAAGDGGHLFIDDIHAVIAAVEDWQDANGFGRMGSLMRRLIDAEAAVERVREACVSSHVDDKGKKVVFLDRIQRALDGAE